MKYTYVLGHRHPDTDSICSAIAYAALLNRNGGGRYIAGRCGELNAESKYALKKFGVEAPVLVMNVEPSVSDLPKTHPEYALGSTPTIDVVNKMDKYDLRNLPIIDEKGKLIGLVSEHGLARAYVSDTKVQNLVIYPIDVDALARILHGKVLVKNHDKLEGSVYITIDALHVMLAHITKKDIAIVGDDEPTQLALIAAGVAALIIADSAPVGDRVIAEAKNHGVTIIETHFDAFGVTKMIHLTLPAETIMSTDVSTVHMDDTLDYVKQIVSNVKYRAACVVDDKGNFISTISRNCLMGDVAKSVILLDHNEYGQAVKGIESAEIEEIVDHHRLGAMTTLKPIRFDMRPLGSTSTIITGRYQEAGVNPNREIAGILLSGILSDTLGLKMSTTTQYDIDAVKYLSEIAEVNSAEYAHELISEGMALAGVSQKELIERDTKEFTMSSRRIVIAQILTPSYDYVKSKKDEIYLALKEKMEEPGSPDVYIALYTSISEMGSDMYAATKDKQLEEKLNWGTPLHLPGIVSRKKDFVPKFGRMLENQL